MKSMLVLCVFLVIGAVQAARIPRQAVTEAAPAETTVDGLNLAAGLLANKLAEQSSLGLPVDPIKANILAQKIAFLTQLSELKKAQAADPSLSGPGAAKPKFSFGLLGA